MDHRFKTALIRSLLLTATELAGYPMTAQADREVWAPALTDQIFEDHQCVVAFLSQVVEREVDGCDVVIAKVHCEDDRAFDIYRDNPLRRFDITECERPNQETC